MTEFSDRPFAAGSVIGLRAFEVDSLGRLIGPTQPQVFLPTENVAECKRSRMLFGGSAVFRGRLSFAPNVMWGPPPHPGCPCPDCQPAQAVVSFDPATDAPEAEEVRAAEPEPEPEPEAKDEPHVVGALDCSCGFYAYFDGSNDYKLPTNVAAIIEGYGVCTIGSRGFRAAKAQLVALVEPKHFTDARKALLRRNYPDVPFYDRKRDALAAHPLTEMPAPSPETDADFWTRTAP